MRILEKFKPNEYNPKLAAPFVYDNSDLSKDENSDLSESVSSSSDENNDNHSNLELEGEIIRNYNIIYELGRGAYSIVWLVYSIVNNNYYALKVQNPTEYKDGLNEINFVKNLPEKPNVFNNLCDSFVEIIDDNKYLCSAWNLHSSNIDSLIRKGNFTSGLPLDQVKIIMKQLKNLK